MIYHNMLEVGKMKKEELTRGKIFSLTSQHRFYFNLMFIFAIIGGILLIFEVSQGGKDFAVPFMTTVSSIIIGVLCCLTYFIDILTMNIKTIEEDSRELLEGISHAKISVGNRIKVNSKNKRFKKLIWYNKVYDYGYDRGRSKNERYNYKTIWYYLGLSKIIVFREYIPIGEKMRCNPKKRKKYYKDRDLNNN